MKFQINTEVKTITIDQAVEAGELFELLNSMFPNFTWKEYLICPVEHMEDWKNPIKIPWQPQPWFPQSPTPLSPIYYPPSSPTLPSYPWITCGTNTNTGIDTGYAVTNSTYNVIVNK